ncbi:hypothetical protein SNEBB_002967 [Seison nebaliae]|nr:hypothetical protein SNEBB_002967 [Seison nebaliae]
MSEDDFKCKTCQLTFDNQQILLDHMFVAHSDPFNESTSLSKIPSLPRMRQEDEMSFTSTKAMVGTPIKSSECCIFCNAVLDSVDSYINHLFDYHLNEPLHAEVAQQLISSKMAKKSPDPFDGCGNVAMENSPDIGLVHETIEDHYEKKMGKCNRSQLMRHDKDVRDFISTRVEPSSNGCREMLPLIGNLFRIGFLHRQPVSYRDRLKIIYCRSRPIFFPSTNIDQGWGCGYRNLQMLLSSLRYVPNLNVEFLRNFQLDDIPSICELQRMIESAWQLGLDPDGASEAQHKIHKTTKWIGTLDCRTLLSWLKIHSKVISSKGNHQDLILWIRKYFLVNDNEAPYLPPLYLQHLGHSTTVVGCIITDYGVKYENDEERKRKELKNTYPILFDPILCMRDLRNFQRDMKKFQVSIYDEYQSEGSGLREILKLMDPFIMTLPKLISTEYEVLKICGKLDPSTNYLLNVPVKDAMDLDILQIQHSSSMETSSTTNFTTTTSNIRQTTHHQNDRSVIRQMNRPFSSLTAHTPPIYRHDIDDDDEDEENLENHPTNMFHASHRKHRRN